MPKKYDDYFVCLDGSNDLIPIADLTEAQAKYYLCRMIDKLESVESKLSVFQPAFQGWRAVSAPRLPKKSKKVRA